MLIPCAAQANNIFCYKESLFNDKSLKFDIWGETSLICHLQSTLQHWCSWNEAWGAAGWEMVMGSLCGLGTACLTDPASPGTEPPIPTLRAVYEQRDPWCEKGWG